MSHIGMANAQGNTVLQSAPTAIVVQEPIIGRIILRMHTDDDFIIHEGVWRGTTVRWGDYYNREHGEYRSKEWLVQHPTLWSKSS